MAADPNIFVGAADDATLMTEAATMREDLARLTSQCVTQPRRLAGLGLAGKVPVSVQERPCCPPFCSLG